MAEAVQSNLGNGITLSALNTAAMLEVSGFGGVAVQIQGTFSGEVTFEASVQGVDFAPFRVVPSNNSTAVTTATAAGLWTGSTVGYKVVRVRMSDYTNGSAVVFLKAVLASPGGSGGGGGVGSDVNLIEVGGSAIALGETTMANSFPVVIASDQTPIPITGSISASNPSVGPTGDPVPAEATTIGFQEPGGDLETFKLESFDYDTNGANQPQTAIGIVIPASGGPVPVSTANPMPVSAASLPLPTGAATLVEQQAQTALLTTIDGDTSALAGTVAGSELQVDVVAALPAGNNNIGDVDAIQSGTWNIGTVTTVTTVSTVTAVTAISNALPAGNNNIGDVDVASVVPGTGATNLGKAIDSAVGATDTGVGALGKRVDTPNTSQTNTDGDYTAVATSSTGAVRIAPPSEDFAALANGPSVKKYYTNAGAVTDGIVWSPAAGKRWYVTDIFVGVSAACTVTFEDDKAGGDEAIFKMEFAANSGWSHGFETPWFSGEDAADLLVTTSAGNVYITITGYEI